VFSNEPPFTNPPHVPASFWRGASRRIIPQLLTVDLILHDRLQQQEEEHKRRLRDATDIGTGAMSNLLTLFNTPDQIEATMRQVKEEVGLVTLKRDYDRLQAEGYPMSPSTYADTLTEYVDPGHLRKSLDTAINTGLIKDDDFGQKTVNRWGALEVIAAHRRLRSNLQPEDYWRMMSEADRGIDQGALLDEIKVLDPMIDRPQGRGLIETTLGGRAPPEPPTMQERAPVTLEPTIGPAPPDTPEMAAARQQAEQQGIVQGWTQQLEPLLQAVPKEYPTGASTFMAATVLWPFAPELAYLTVGQKVVSEGFPKVAEVAGKAVGVVTSPMVSNLTDLGIPEAVAKPLADIVLFGSVGKAPAGQRSISEAVAVLRGASTEDLAATVTAFRKGIVDGEAGWLSLGARVKAADRENLGTVVSFDEAANTARVHFYNRKTGARATVTLDAALLSPAGKAATGVAEREATIAMQGAVAAARAEQAGPLVGKMYRTLESAQYLTETQKREAAISAARHGAAGAQEAILSKSTPETFVGSLRQAQAARRGITSADIELGEPWTAGEIAEFGNKVVTSPLLKPFEKTRGGEAVLKLLEGKQILMPSEVKLIAKVYPELESVLMNVAKPKGVSLFRQIVDIVNIPRALQAAYDLSFPLRQGGLLIGRKEFWGALGPMTKAGIPNVLGKTPIGVDAANSELMSMVESQYWDRARVAGLSIGDPGTGIVQAKALDVPNVEEAWVSRLATKIPGVGESQRAYTTAGNNMRWNYWVNHVKSWDAMGIKYTAADEKALATWVNIATGWGKIGNLEKVLPELSTILFAPRFLASRLEAYPYGIYTILTNPILRKAVAYDLASFTALQAGLLAFMKYGIDGKGIPGVTVELDPRSTDVGRIKIGNTRIDTLAGFQPVFRTVAQLITGQGKSTAGGETYSMNRLTTAARYLQSKEAPGLGFLTELAAGESYIGEPTEPTPGGVKRTAWNRLTPFLIQDIVDAVRGNSPGVAALVGVLGLFGATTLTYETPWQKLEDQRGKASQSLYKMSLTDLREQYGTNAANAMLAADPSVVAADQAVEDRKKWYGNTNTSLKTGLLPFTAEQLKADTTIPDPQQWRDNRKTRQEARAGFIAGFYFANPEQRDRMVKEREQLGDPFTIPKNALPDDIVGRYLAIFTDHTNIDTGTVDDKDALYEDLDRFQAMLTPQQTTWLEGNLGLKATPREKTYLAGVKQLQPYFDIPEQVYQKNKEGLLLTAPSYTAYRMQADEEARANARAEGLGPEMVGDQHYPYAWQQLKTWIEIERRNYLLDNPDKADLAIALGFKEPSKVDIARRRSAIEEEALNLPLPEITPSPLRPVGMPGR